MSSEKYDRVLRDAHAVRVNKKPLVLKNRLCLQNYQLKPRVVCPLLGWAVLRERAVIQMTMKPLYATLVVS